MTKAFAWSGTVTQITRARSSMNSIQSRSLSDRSCAAKLPTTLSTCFFASLAAVSILLWESLVAGRSRSGWSGRERMRLEK